jgi:hypothetical protein
MLSKEDEFRERFVAVMQDLREGQKDNPEAMFLIGSLAARLIDKAGQKNWAAYKASLGEFENDALLVDLRKKGNDFYAQGKDMQAYALQVLGTSVIARTQNDPQVRAGNRLLDEMIDFYVKAFRRAEKMPGSRAN